MVNFKATTPEADAQLDRVFSALSDTTRRRVLAQLDQGGGAASVSELALAHAMSLPGFMKHLAVLEAAGLIARAKEGRVVRCELDALPMQGAAQWMDRYARFWNDQFDALGRYLYHQEETTPWTTPPTTPPSSSKRKSVSSGTTPSRPKKSGAPGPSRKRS